VGPDYRGQLAERLRQATAACGSVLTDRESVTTAVRGFIDAERAALREKFLASPTGSKYSLAHSLIFDVVLAGLLRLANEVVTDQLGPIPAEAQLCVAAVGGYGRASLSPWSDIDMVFIPASEDNEAIDAVVREMLMLMGETLVPGRHPLVAHSYRPLGDLGLIDHQTATALLESRFIAGDDSLHIHFLQRLMRSIEPVEFLHLNLEERRVVWESANQSVFAVEPNLKNGPGGLRDFHAAIWVSKVVYSIQEWDILSVLRQRGVVSWDDSLAVLDALEFLLVCRNWLHDAKGQKLDVLHVDYQQPMAAALGYATKGEVTAGEQLMRDVYRSARIIHSFSRRLLEVVQRQRLDFRHGTHVAGWALYPNHDGIFAEEPGRLVYLYEERQRLQLDSSVELDRLIAQNLGRLDASVRERAAVGSSFVRILGSEQDVAGTVRDMMLSGVLERLLPELEPLMFFLPGDPAHEYTVGEHSLKVADELQRLRDKPFGEDEQTLSQAMEAIQEPEVLFLAALFHDIGKLDRGNDHSTTGAPVGEKVALRLGMQSSAAKRVRFLIQEHLTMTRTARLRATTLPETIDNFVAVLPEDAQLDALDMLMLLTTADASSVGRDVFRENERRLLMELFIKAARWVQERPIVDEPGATERISRRLRSAPAFRDIDPERIRRHLAGMPTWYAVNTPPALIAKHMSYLERIAQGEAVVVEFYHALQAMHTELTTCLEDRPGILRDIAAAVTANNLDIYLVQSDVCVLTEPKPRQVAIATIWVDDYGQPLGQVKKDRLRADLEKLLTGQEEAAEVLARRGKTVPDRVVLHGIGVNNADSRQHTVVNIRADDQKGLLFRLTDAMASEQLDISVAKVTTWRGAAEDAFYVRSLRHKRKLTDEEAERVTDRLRERLGGEDAAE